MSSKAGVKVAGREKDFELNADLRPDKSGLEIVIKFPEWKFRPDVRPVRA